MKKCLLVLLAFLVCGVASAASTATIPMSANINEAFELSVIVFEGDIPDDLIVPMMDFGDLVQADLFEPYVGDKHFTCLITANTSAREYDITQTAAALTNGSDTLPAGACITTPHNNGQTLPTGSALGTQGSFIATNKLVYSSNPAGDIFGAAAVYAITDDPGAGATEAIPASQPAGTYTTSVVFTLVLA